MRRTLHALTLVLLAAACTERGDTVTRTIELAHMDAEQAIMLVEPYVDGGATMIRRTDSPNALTITASEERLDQVTELLQRFDVPAPGVKLHFQIIEADGFTTTDSAIAAVESSLRELFRFRGYRLAAEALLSGSAHSHAEQHLIGPAETPMTIAVGIGRITAVEGRSALELQISLSMPGMSILQTTVTVPDGQTVVLGSARPFRELGAIILVVRPEIE